MTDKTLLVDGDILVYQHAFGVEEDHSFDEGDNLKSADLDLAVSLMVEWVDNLKAKFKADALVCLTDRHHNFRKDILPTYKASRSKTSKPLIFNDLLAACHDVFECSFHANMEADDVMGIHMTSDAVVKGRKCIVSADKDMQTIPGKLYNPRKSNLGVRTITKEFADNYHMLQSLMGDAVDNYKGCPGIGIKKATKILDEAEEPWPAIVATYEAKGLTEADALVQAQVARILRAEDYDFQRRAITLWQPSLLS